MSQKSRWTQYDEDSYRLPEGFRRIAYDADTRRYTFRDSKGDIYQGESGVLYGTMTPMVPTNSAFETSRPSAFDTGASRPIRSSTMPSSMDVPTTFHDILPPELITSSSLSANPSPLRSGSSKSSSAFVDTVRKSALPKMQGVVHGLRRSMTSMRKPKVRGPDQASRLSSIVNDLLKSEDDTRGLMRHDSSISASRSSIGRSSSIATARTDQSRGSVMTIQPVVQS